MTDTERPPGADSGGRSALAGVRPVEGDNSVPETVKTLLPAGVYMTSDHRYYLNGQGPVPSVTTVLEVLSKPALVTWKAQEAVRALFRSSEAFLSEDQAVKWALANVDSTRDKAAGIGTGVHLLADMVSRRAVSDGDGFQVSEEERPYLEAFRGFLAFLEAAGGRIVSSEHAVWSVNGYAGTYDLIVELPNEKQNKLLWLIDIKTSKGYYPEYGLQLAGYRWADYIVLPGDPNTYPMPPIDRTGILHLRPDQYAEGWRLVEYPTEYKADYLTFLGALEIWKWRKEGRFQKQVLNTVFSTES